MSGGAQRGPRSKPAVNRGGHRGGSMGAIGRPAEKAKDFKGTLKRLSGYLKPYAAPLAASFALVLLSTAISTAVPKLLGLAINSMYHFASGKSQMDMPYIAKVLAVMGLLFAVNSIFTFIYQRSLANAAIKTVNSLRRDLDRKLARVPLSYFDSTTHGELMSRITNDSDNVNSALQQGLPQLLGALAGIIGALTMMLVISPLLTLIAALTLPLSFFITMVIAKSSQKFYASQQKSLGELNSHVEEMLSGHVIVRAFCYEKESLEKFDAINSRLYDAGWKAQFISGFIFPVMNFINNLGYVAVCVAGGIMTAKRAMELGDVQAFIQYIRMLTQPVAQSASMINTLQSAVASLERIFEVLNEPEESPDEGMPDAPASTSGAVVFSGVKFGYGTGAMLFDGLDLEAKPGDTVAIVGPTGAGKTTLVNLLMRFYEITGGSITVDGRDITCMKRGGLRRMFGMVLQDTWLFSGTISDNIAYGKPGATDAEIKAAAVTARADHFIRSLPEGYNTVLSEDASNLSQGEKQLLTIARAVLLSPPMLILDEATSSVDTRTEQLIQHAMMDLMKGRTSFVIAHRLS
ncbi:MAG: ABC transporter ATP-binding protein/permease, partial [Spirochaetia bacterium]|nr:ABC transporter ATP-binding protein/permease [Spirochaetia bacterium]